MLELQHFSVQLQPCNRSSDTEGASHSFKDVEHSGWNCPTWHTTYLFFSPIQKKAFSLHSPTLDTTQLFIFVCLFCTTVISLLRLSGISSHDLFDPGPVIFYLYSFHNQTTPPLSHAHALKFSCPGVNI